MVLFFFTINNYLISLSNNSLDTIRHINEQMETRLRCGHSSKLWTSFVCIIINSNLKVFEKRREWISTFSYKCSKFRFILKTTMETINYYSLEESNLKVTLLICKSFNHLIANSKASPSSTFRMGEIHSVC